MFPWHLIDTVLFDMDGTVLDLRFDNHFWLEHMPRRYGEKFGLPDEQARTELLTRYREVEGTLAWYCIDYWTAQLDLDVATLKREVEHLITVRPYAEALLDALRQAGKRVLLVTNAHPGSLSLKMEKTRLQGHFDALITAHEFGMPKENPDFWPRLQTKLNFNPATTLLIEDSATILRTARTYGIAYLLMILQPDSANPPRAPDDFPAVHHFSELLPLD